MSTFKSFFRRTLFAGALMAFSSAPSMAAVIAVNGNTGDGEVNSTTVQDGGGSVSNLTKNGTLLAGTFNTTIISPVFVFQLPTLAADEVLVGANLDVRVLKAQSPAFNADLYGLPGKSTNALTGADFYAGPLDVTSATLLQDDEFTPTNTTSSSAVVGTSAVGDAALLTYLNDQYATVGAGGFVFLRFSPDFATNPGTTSSLGYAISSAETAAGSRPVLTFTTESVPEPGSALLLAGAAGLLLNRRRTR